MLNMKSRSFGFDWKTSISAPRITVTYSGNHWEGSRIRQAIFYSAVQDYRRQRENGIAVDSPSWPFPADGRLEWVEEIDVTEWPDQNHPPRKDHFRGYYTEGLDDKAWMEEKDRNYLARLQREKQSALLFEWHRTHKYDKADEYQAAFVKQAISEWDPKCTKPNGQTLLHVAALQYSPEHIDFYVKQGIPVDAVDDTGTTAIDIAIDRDNPVIVRALSRQYPEESFNMHAPKPLLWLQRALIKGSRQVFEALVHDPRTSQLVHHVDEQGQSAILVAFKKSDMAAVKLLLNTGATLLVKGDVDDNDSKITYNVLSQCVANDVDPVLVGDTLLALRKSQDRRLQAALNHVTQSITPLALAIMRHHIWYIKLFVYSGARLYPVNDAAQSAFHLALIEMDDETCEKCFQIFKKSSKFNTEILNHLDGLGRAPLHIATDEKRQYAGRWLLGQAGINKNIVAAQSSESKVVPPGVSHTVATKEEAESRGVFTLERTEIIPQAQDDDNDAIEGQSTQMLTM